MGTLNEDLSAIKEVEDKIVANKVARFAYTDEAYTTNDANGVAEYNVSKEQNIPTADASVLKVNETVLSKGYRAQASSVTRMLLNHFFGRMSYNLNKVNDIVSNLITTLIGHRGTANGFATLDENGRIPYSQLPESAMEYKGQWNAETNTPTLVDGTGTKGDFYIVSVGGTQDLGSGNIQFFVNDRIIYDGSVWTRLSAGDVNTVNNVLPTNGNVALTGENIPVSSTDPTLLSAPLTTDRYADSSVTTEKIADKAVTNAKIADKVVTNAKIADNAVTTEKIANNAVTNAKIADKAVTNAKIADNAVTTEKIVNNAVTDAKIADKAVTNAKIADNAVTNAKIVNNAVTTEKIADNAVTNAKIKEPISVANGGTGATTAENGFNTLANGVRDSANPVDKEKMLIKPTTGTWYKTTCLDFWNYIKDKISSVLGLTATQYNGNAKTANKIEPNYTSVSLPLVTSTTTKYIKVADCPWNSTGTLQVSLSGNNLVDTLVINFGGGNSLTPMLCGYYSGNSFGVSSVIVQKGSDWVQNYSIYVKVRQKVNCDVQVALLKGECTINVTDSTTAPTNIYEWTVKYGFFGDFTGNFTGDFTGNFTGDFIGNVHGSTGIGMVHTCSTSVSTKTKTVSIPGFTLTQGACIRVVFNNGNDATTPTLKVNDTREMEIWCARGVLDKYIGENSGNPDNLKKGHGVYNWDTFTVLDLYYDGAHWIVLGDPIVKRFYDGTPNLRRNFTITGIRLESFLY